MLGHHSVALLVVGEGLATIANGSMDALLVRLALVVNMIFLALGYNHYNSSLPLSAGAAHSLDQSNGALWSIETDNEVYVTNVQSLLPDTSCY